MERETPIHGSGRSFRHARPHVRLLGIAYLRCSSSGRRCLQYRLLLLGRAAGHAQEKQGEDDHAEGAPLVGAHGAEAEDLVQQHRRHSTGQEAGHAIEGGVEGRGAVAVEVDEDGDEGNASVGREPEHRAELPVDRVESVGEVGHLRRLPTAEVEGQEGDGDTEGDRAEGTDLLDAEDGLLVDLGLEAVEDVDPKAVGYDVQSHRAHEHRVSEEVEVPLVLLDEAGTDDDGHGAEGRDDGCVLPGAYLLGRVSLVDQDPVDEDTDDDQARAHDDHRDHHAEPEGVEQGRRRDDEACADAGEADPLVLRGVAPQEAGGIFAFQFLRPSLPQHVGQDDGHAREERVAEKHHPVDLRDLQEVLHRHAEDDVEREVASAEAKQVFHRKLSIGVLC
jgi:hypothetical protein